MIAAVLSIIATNLVRLPDRYSSGLQFTTRWLLKLGIILYGLNFSYALWAKPGSQWILVIGLMTVAIPMIAAYHLGKALGLNVQSRVLVAAGTGICGSLQLWQRSKH